MYLIHKKVKYVPESSIYIPEHPEGALPSTTTCPYKRTHIEDYISKLMLFHLHEPHAVQLLSKAMKPAVYLAPWSGTPPGSCKSKGTVCLHSLLEIDQCIFCVSSKHKETDHFTCVQ